MNRPKTESWNVSIRKKRVWVNGVQTEIVGGSGGYRLVGQIPGTDLIVKADFSSSHRAFHFQTRGELALLDEIEASDRNYFPAVVANGEIGRFAWMIQRKEDLRFPTVTQYVAGILRRLKRKYKIEDLRDFHVGGRPGPISNWALVGRKVLIYDFGINGLTNSHWEITSHCDSSRF